MFSTDDSLGDEDFFLASIDIDDIAASVPPSKRSRLSEPSGPFPKFSSEGVETSSCDSDSRSPVIGLVAPPKLNEPGFQFNNQKRKSGPAKFNFKKSPENTIKSDSIGSSLDKGRINANASSFTSSHKNTTLSSTHLHEKLFAVSQESGDSDLDLTLEGEVNQTPKRPQETSRNGGSITNTVPKTTYSPLNTVQGPEIINKDAPTIIASSSSKIPDSNQCAQTFKTPQVTPSIRKLRTPQLASTAAKPTSPAPAKTTCASPWNTPSTTIPRPSTSTPSSSKQTRIFPGPAGIIPELKPGMSLKDALQQQSSTPSPGPKATNLTSSQSVDDFSNDELWKLMQDDLEPQASRILNDYSLASLQNKAAEKVLPKGKAPVICARIESISLHNEDATVMLRDSTSTMKGTVHKQLVKSNGRELVQGAVVVLRQVAVFSPSAQSHYLNITPNNVVRIYTKADAEEVKTHKLSSFSERDFVIPVVKPRLTPITPQQGRGSPRPGAQTYRPRLSGTSQPGTPTYNFRSPVSAVRTPRQNTPLFATTGNRQPGPRSQSQESSRNATPRYQFQQRQARPQSTAVHRPPTPNANYTTSKQQNGNARPIVQPGCQSGKQNSAPPASPLIQTVGNIQGASPVPGNSGMSKPRFTFSATNSNTNLTPSNSNGPPPKPQNNKDNLLQKGGDGASVKELISGVEWDELFDAF